VNDHIPDIVFAVIGISVPLTILVRTFRNGLFRAYPRFSLLISLFLLGSASSPFMGNASHPVLYFRFYWTMELIQFLVEAAVLFDILSTDQFACAHISPIIKRLRWTIGGAICLCSIVGFRSIFILPLAWTMLASFRDIAGVAALLLLFVLFLSAYFGIRFGSNMTGLICGLGFNSAGCLIAWSLMFRFHINTYTTLGFMVPCVDGGALIIWLISMWNIHPDPVPDLEAIHAALREPLPKRFHRLGLSVLAYLSDLFRTPHNA